MIDGRHLANPFACRSTVRALRIEFQTNFELRVKKNVNWETSSPTLASLNLEHAIEVRKLRDERTMPFEVLVVHRCLNDKPHTWILL